jgi:hypothetical protein
MGNSNRSSEVHNGNAVHYTFGEDEASGMVQSYFVPSMGHVWPSGSNGEVLKATNVLMDFFSKWSIEKREKAAATLPETGAGAHLVSIPQSLILACIAALFVLGSV